MRGLHLREIDPVTPTDADLDALVGLDAAVTDGGRITFTARHLLPPREHLRLLRAGSAGVLASDGDGRAVGSAWVRFGRFRLAGREAGYALLHSLQVHPDARRQGVATALTGWRLDRAADREAVPLATIQLGNEASLANARRWATTFSDPLTVTPVPLRGRPPRQHRGWTVRLATEADLDVLTAGLDAQHRGFGVAPDPDDLGRWLDGRFHRYWVITGPDDVPLAGVGIDDEARHTEVLVSGLPAAMRWAGRLAGVVPAGGVMRNLNVRLPWHAPGAASSGRLLWQHVRYRERHHGTALVTTLDPRHPAAAMSVAPRWIPTTGIVVANATGPIELPL